MKIRINNIEFRKYNSTKRNNLYEIVKFTPNIYYNKEQGYRDNGYVDSFLEGFLQNGTKSIQKSVFILPESCYTIAFIKKDSESWELRSVGERLVDLTEEDWNDFYHVYSMGQTKLNKL